MTRLHNEKHYALYSPHILRVIRKETEEETMWQVWGGRICAYRVLVGIPDGKRPLARPRSRWEDNTRVSP